MKQGKTLVLLIVALSAGCGGQSAASSTQNQGAAATVTQAAISDGQSAVTESPTALPDAEGPETSQDAGLFRPSFDECVTKAEGMTADTQACIEGEFEFQDARLQLAYQKEMQSLKGQALQASKQAQEAWLEKREKECAWDAAHEGQGQRLDANYCKLRSTAMRANELEEMLTNQN